jgi:hypothetical protein
MTVRTRRILVGCTAAVTAFALVGCGSSSKSSASAGASTAATTPPTTVSGASSTGSGSSTTSDTPATTAGKRTGTALNTCSLLSAAQVSALVGQTYTSATPKTIALGQDQCTYANTAAAIDLTVIVYSSGSGVTFDTLTSAQGGDAVASVSGVGDKAIAGDIELDIQAGDRAIAVQGAGPKGSSPESVAVGKAVVAALG